MGQLWEDCIFLGYHRDSNTYVLADANGIVYSRSIMRKAPVDRWNLKEVEKFSATPWMVREKAKINVHFTQLAETKEEPKPHEMLPMPKKFQINLSI